MTKLSTTELHQIANVFCITVANWGFYYNPERMEDLYAPRSLIVADDVCDSNMAMDHALRRFGYGELIDRWLNEEDGQKRDEIMEKEVAPIWNAAYDIAMSNCFMPVAGKTGQLFMIAWPRGYHGDPDPEVVEPSYFTAERGFKKTDLDEINSSFMGNVINCSGVVDECYVVNLGNDETRRAAKLKLNFNVERSPA